MTRLQLQYVLAKGNSCKCALFFYSTSISTDFTSSVEIPYFVSSSPSDSTQIGLYLAHFAYLPNTKRAKTKAISLSSSLGRISSSDNAARWESPKSQSQPLPTFPFPVTHSRLTRFVIFNKILFIIASRRRLHLRFLLLMVSFV